MTHTTHRCYILPPVILTRVAEQGTAEDRDAAFNTLASSAGMRARRAVLQRLGQEVSPSLMGSLFKPKGERRTVYDMENGGGGSLPGVKVRGEGDPPSKDTSVNEAYDGADATYDFYKDILDRDSLDGNGMELISSVHYGVDFDNAFWQGTQMVYGDGSGRFLVKGSLTSDVSVIAHEMTHGVTQFTAGLVYSKQSGALNESWSDVLGSLVKQYVNKETVEDADWLIGEGLLGPSLGGTALRSMKAPGTAFKFDTQPDHMDKYQDLPDDNNPRNDNGGVHINSGIPNKAFYLAATEFGGYAWEKAGPIWYHALVDKLKPQAQFTDAVAATVAAATELYGAAEAKVVQDAWKQVGL
ncbi:MAG TPA: M4 family metallopeptidase [Acidimicrobiales bacterium]|nr:M4 family metallopeptidase [Acidimicrobiales bacterium]